MLIRFFVASFMLAFLLFSCSSKGASAAGWRLVSDILKQIDPPQFPARDFDITTFGAVGDGRTLNTDAFARAIAACSAAGGGRVVAPAGTFLTGAIHLQNNVNLHVTKNATILFSPNPQDYLPVVYTRFEGTECMNYSPFIYAFAAENIAITGSGTLDGGADSTNWWVWKGLHEFGWRAERPNGDNDVAILLKMAEENIPVEQRIFGAGHYLRPNFIQPYKCKNILIDSVTIVRSPMWEIHPVLCENVTVQNVRVISHGPNNDGCNPESSKNVRIKNCYFDTGDDCIAIKSGRNADGRRISVPSENIIVQGCTMKDGHGGVVIGSEMSGGCRYVFIEDCQMSSPNLDRALRIKTNSLRGGFVENIYMRNITVGQVSDAVIHINFYYESGDVGQFTPVVRNIHISNVTSQKSNFAFFFDAYARSPIANITVENCDFKQVVQENVLNHVENIRLKNVFINGERLEEPMANPAMQAQ